MAALLLFIGWGIALVGGIIFLVAAFQESLLWGLGCIFIPFVSLFFLVMHWEDAKKGFLIQLAAIPFIVGAILLGGDSAIAP